MAAIEYDKSKSITRNSNHIAGFIFRAKLFYNSIIFLTLSMRSFLPLYPPRLRRMRKYKSYPK
jgi:hypothetical protein